MPKGAPPQWNRRDCRFDYLVVATLRQGLGQPLLYTGVTTPERAFEIKQGFYRCARHRAVSAEVAWQHSGRRVTTSELWPPDRQHDGTYQLELTLYSKAAGRSRHIEVYGPDRGSWPYNPRRGKNEQDTEAWQAQGLDQHGRRVK